MRPVTESEGAAIGSGFASGSNCGYGTVLHDRSSGATGKFSVASARADPWLGDRTGSPPPVSGQVHIRACRASGILRIRDLCHF